MFDDVNTKTITDDYDQNVVKDTIDVVTDFCLYTVHTNDKHH